MNVNGAALDKKRILADPLAALAHAAPGADADLLARLQRLNARQTGLDEEREALREQTRQLSRRIGEAKRAGESIEPLKATMREASGRLKATEQALAEIQADILASFELPQTASPERSPSDAPRIKQRHYRSSGAHGVRIGLIDAAQDTRAWNDYVDSNPAATTYHRAEWLPLIQRTFGHRGYYFWARNSAGTVVGVLPLVRLKSRLFGDFLISMPYFNYGGALAESPEIELALMRAARDQAVELGVEHIEYRDDIPRQDMPVRHDKVDMVLELPPTVEALLTGFSAKLRSQIKRAQREAPQIEIGGLDCVEDFYSVFSRNMRDLGTPVYARRLFENILTDFPEQARIVVVKLHGRPVASGFLLAHGSRMEIPWASTVRDYNRLSVNMILYWEALRYCVESGFKQFDFGRSSRDASTFRFKRQWGAQPEQLHWHYDLITAQHIPSITPGNAKYALMINTWKKLPLALTRWIGPPIVKNIP